MSNESKGNGTKRGWVWVMLCGVLIALGGGYGTLQYVGSIAFPKETRDIGKYGEKLKEWGADAAHFPAAVPVNAEDVHFAAEPKVLQGVGYMQLRVKLPEVEIERLDTLFKSKAIVAQFADPSLPNYVFPPTFWAGGISNARVKFPDEFVLHILGAKNLGGKWDNGETRGVAISRATREIVYWVEYW